MRGLILFLSLFVLVFFVFNSSCISKEVPVTETYYETQYKTEYKTETHNEVEDVIVKTVEGKQEIYNSGGWFSAVLSLSSGEGDKTYYYHYMIETNKHTRSRITIMVFPATYGYIGVYDFTGIGEIDAPPTPSAWEPQAIISQRNAWSSNLNSILTNPSRLLGSYTRSSFWNRNENISNEISFDANGIKEFAIFANTNPDNAITGVELSWSDDIIEKKAVTKEVQVPYETSVKVEKQRTVIQAIKVPFWEVPRTGNKVGDKAPNFTLESLDGRNISLSDFKGTKVLIIFTSVHCTASEKQMSYIVGAYQKGKGKFAVLNIYIMVFDPILVQDYVTTKELTTFPSLPDRFNAVANAYGAARYTPTNFIIDETGTIKFKKIGPFQSQKEIEEIFNSL